jgi:hypothetical protein
MVGLDLDHLVLLLLLQCVSLCSDISTTLAPGWQSRCTPCVPPGSRTLGMVWQDEAHVPVATPTCRKTFYAMQYSRRYQRYESAFPFSFL